MLNTKEQIANQVIKLSKTNLFDNKRTRNNVEARALLSYILFKFKHMRVSEIARFFHQYNKKMNHATIIYYIKNFNIYQTYNSKLCDWLDAITMNLREKDIESKKIFIRSKIELLNDKNINGVLRLVKKLAKKQILEQIERYEKQIQDFT